MPCIKCSNGKYKYGEHGNCEFDTLGKCKEAAAAIHIQEGADKSVKTKTKVLGKTDSDAIKQRIKDNL
jgi:hypothetical protein